MGENAAGCLRTAAQTWRDAAFEKDIHFLWPSEVRHSIGPSKVAGIWKLLRKSSELYCAAVKHSHYARLTGRQSNFLRHSNLDAPPSIRIWENAKSACDIRFDRPSHKSQETVEAEQSRENRRRHAIYPVQFLRFGR
jgi:hypothetical protein